MKYYTVRLKEEFPNLSTAQEPTLTCYINESLKRSAPERKNPAILICPGGAYTHICYDREGEQVAFKFLEAGYNVFTLNYSVIPESYPAQLLEAACSMLYIRKNAVEHRTDAENVFICGFSAGAHLAASLGVFFDDEEIDTILGVKPESIMPDAMVLGYPVISADSAIAHIGSIQNVSGTQDVNAPIYQKMSLENQVKSNTPPTFLWHTFEDNGVSACNSLVFANALATNKVKYELHIYPYGGHGMAGATENYNAALESNGYYCSPWLDESIKFLKALRKGRSFE